MGILVGDIRNLDHPEPGKLLLEFVEGFHVCDRPGRVAGHFPVRPLHVHLHVSERRRHPRYRRPQAVQQLVEEDDAFVARRKIGEEEERVGGVVGQVGHVIQVGDQVTEDALLGMLHFAVRAPASGRDGKVPRQEAPVSEILSAVDGPVMGVARHVDGERRKLLPSRGPRPDLILESQIQTFEIVHRNFLWGHLEMSLISLI